MSVLGVAVAVLAVSLTAAFADFVRDLMSTPPAFQCRCPHCGQHLATAASDYRCQHCGEWL